MAFAAFKKLDLPEARSQFAYLKRLSLYESQKPYYCSIELQPEELDQKTNLDYERKDAVVRDIRGWEHELDFERDGIQYIRHPTSFVLLKESRLDIEGYMKEHIDFFRQKLDAEKCICYSWRYRTAGPSTRIQTSFKSEEKSEPAETPHIDQTTAGGLRRVRAHLRKEEQNLYTNGNWRLRIVNIWRPLFNPVYNDALAVCDPASFDAAADLIACDRVNPEYIGEIYYLHHSQNQRWYSLSHQSPDEMLCFVSYDSESGFQNAFLPHASFKVDTKEEYPKRESVELRLIVISKKTDDGA